MSNSIRLVTLVKDAQTIHTNTTMIGNGLKGCPSMVFQLCTQLILKIEDDSHYRMYWWQGKTWCDLKDRTTFDELGVRRLDTIIVTNISDDGMVDSVAGLMLKMAVEDRKNKEVQGEQSWDNAAKNITSGN